MTQVIGLKLKKDELVICLPDMEMTEPQENWYLRRIALDAFKQEIIKGDFIEGRDYDVCIAPAGSSSQHTLRIKGKGPVIRALGYLNITMDIPQRNKYVEYGTEISEQECDMQVLPDVEYINNHLFAYIKNRASIIHAKFIHQSSVMDNFSKDIALIDKHKNNPIFGETKYLLAFSSLANAIFK